MFFNVERVREVTPKESSPESSQPLPLPSSSSSQIPSAASMGFPIKETGSLSSNTVWGLLSQEEPKKVEK